MLTISGQRLLSSSVSLKSVLAPFQIISIKRLIDPFYSGLYGAVGLYIILVEVNTYLDVVEQATDCTRPV